MLSRIVPGRLRNRTGSDDREEGAERIYAIGDVHGRLDLFTRLVSFIRMDHAARGPVPARLILLGDLIDRGPDSAALVGWCRRLTESTDRFIVLKGNHEALMAMALGGDVEALAFWLEQGGRETLASWGVPPEVIGQGPGSSLIREAKRIVGAGTLSWMASLPTMERRDGHVFVHAGVRPGSPLNRQKEEDLLWIRRPFLDSEEDHGAIVVHGHTVHEGGPDIRRNRINIDTGAYRTGMLTAIGIEAGKTWFLSTGAPAATGSAERSVLLRAASR